MRPHAKRECLVEVPSLRLRGDHEWVDGEDVGGIETVEAAARAVAVEQPATAEADVHLDLIGLHEAEGGHQVAEQKLIEVAVAQPLGVMVPVRRDAESVERVEPNPAAGAVDVAEVVAVLDAAAQ